VSVPKTAPSASECLQKLLLNPKLRRLGRDWSRPLLLQTATYGGVKLSEINQEKWGGDSKEKQKNADRWDGPDH